MQCTIACDDDGMEVDAAVGVLQVVMARRIHALPGIQMSSLESVEQGRVTTSTGVVMRAFCLACANDGVVCSRLVEERMGRGAFIYPPLK